MSDGCPRVSDGWHIGFFAKLQCLMGGISVFRKVAVSDVCLWVVSVVSGIPDEWDK